MKCRIRPQKNEHKKKENKKDELKILRQKCHKAAMEALDRYLFDIDSIIAWELRKKGWGKKKITDFFCDMLVEREEMRAYYDANNTDDKIAEFAMRYKLKEDGIDMEEIYNKMYEVKAQLEERLK